MIVGRKRLPDAESHERNWGFVTLVSDDASDIEKELREEHYETRTRGGQDQPAARPAGEGVYVITREGSPETGQMHLAYELELPETPGAVQKAFRIAPKAAFALSVKNPSKGSPANAGLAKAQTVDFPKKLQEAFRDRRFESETPVEDADFLAQMQLKSRMTADYDHGLDLITLSRGVLDEHADQFQDVYLRFQFFESTDVAHRLTTPHPVPDLYRLPVVVAFQNENSIVRCPDLELGKIAFRALDFELRSLAIHAQQAQSLLAQALLNVFGLLSVFSAGGIKIFVDIRFDNLIARKNLRIIDAKTLGVLLR